MDLLLQARNAEGAKKGRRNLQAQLPHSLFLSPFLRFPLTFVFGVYKVISILRLRGSELTRRRSVVALTLLLGLWAEGSAQKRPFTFDEMMKVKRVSDPQLSPDNKSVAYTVTAYDVEKNSRNSDVWVVPASGGLARQLTHSPAADERPRWSPDGKSLAFISARSGSSQIWILPVVGGEATFVDTSGLEASGVLWSPNGKHLLFVSEVYPDCQELDCSQKREKERSSNPVKAKMLKRLLFRHWDSWKDGKRSHLFIVAAAGGKPRDLTAGDFDVPPFSLGGPDDYSLSPDGKELCFVRNTDPDEALSTNNDLFAISLEGSGPARKITTNLAADVSPRYSPDGRYIAYRAQVRPGYESDRWRLMVYDRGDSQVHSLTESLDRSVEGFVWSPDSLILYLIAGDQALQPVYKVSLQGQGLQKIIESHTNDDLQLSSDGKTLVFTRQSLAAPVDIYSAKSDGSQLKALTQTNKELLSGVELIEPESVWFTGAEGVRVQTWILKPPKFDSSKKYPLLLAIHGGPQGVWGDAMSYRWNGQVFAARGYVVLMPNPRGSTTFGQEFVDGIRGDWGGKVYEDLMKAADYGVNLNYVDKNRLGAVGGSFGGYMVNWILGNTDRFKCLVSHAGVFNLTSMYGVTEELWFPEWEFLGAPWKNRENYERWSPHNLAKNFKTPMLVIHGELDYRVPIGEGFQLFTYLQRLKLPSKMLYFPDEGHWISKPKNSELWYSTFLEWLDQHLRE